MPNLIALRIEQFFKSWIEFRQIVRGKAEKASLAQCYSCFFIVENG